MTYPAYPEYKDSGVEWLGKVPTHWGVRRLRYVAELNPSKSEVRSLPAESYVSFIPMEAVGDDGALLLDQTRPINEVLAGYTYVREGDVTIAKITPCFENGKGAVMRGLENHVGFGTTELTVMRPKASFTTSDYLYRVVLSEPFRVLGESSMYGAGGQKRVPDDFVRNFTIAWPPYKEQVEIQAFLDHETARIDALVEEQQRLIELLKEKRQALISHAVTKGLDPDVPMKDSGVEWLGEVPAHWEVMKFVRCVFIAEGQVDPKSEKYRSKILLAPNHVESATGRITHFETAEEQGAESGKYICKPGDVVYSKIRPVLRKACILSQEALCSADMYPLRPFCGLTSNYLLWSILSEPFSRLAVLESERVAMPKINRESLNEVYLAVPPEQEQEIISSHIAEEIKALDELVSLAKSSVRLLQERRSALISATVTGKIDVRGWQPPEHLNTQEASRQEAV